MKFLPDIYGICPLKLTIDSDHSTIRALIGAVDHGLSGKLPRSDPRIALQRLWEFLQVHFSAEELLMKLYRYPAAEAHHANHDRLLAAIEAVRRALMAGGTMVAAEAFRPFLAAHDDHEAGDDHRLRCYFKNIGAAVL